MMLPMYLWFYASSGQDTEYVALECTDPANIIDATMYKLICDVLASAESSLDNLFGLTTDTGRKIVEIMC